MVGYDETKLLKKIKMMFDESLDVRLDEKLGEKFKEKFGNLPSKDQFYEETLKLMKRLDDIESQTKMLSNRTYDNTDRLDQLEKIHPDYTHNFA